MNIKHELCLLNVGVHQLATFSTENYTLIVVGPLALDSSGRGPETTYSMGFFGRLELRKMANEQQFCWQRF